MTKAGARFIRRARRSLTARYGRVMEIMLGPRWDLDWLDEAAACVDQLEHAAGLTPEQWRARADRAFDLFTTGRRFDPVKWNRYVHTTALRLQALTILAASKVSPA